MNQKVHYNKPQLESLLVDAPEQWSILGRGTGKTEGILAPKISKRIIEMPRSNRVLIGRTFQQILTRTLPPLVSGWERLGYKLGTHYLIGVKPTEKWKKLWNWRGPYRPPFKYEHVITWWNGAVMQLVSQDRIGSTNGMSIDGIDGDEAKLLNRDRLHSETFPANRGIIHAFQNNPHHHGITFTTDMPVGTAGRWILEKEKEADPIKVKQIMQLHQARYDKDIELQMCQTLSLKYRLQKEIELIDRYILDLRKGLVYFQEASTLSNIHMLGVSYFKQMLRNVSDFEFTTSILNRRPNKLEDGFYPDLDEEKHGYFSYDYHQFEKVGYDFQALAEKNGVDVDADYNKDIPIHISLDYNRRITPMVVAQVYPKEIRTINAIHSKYPEKLDDTLNKFCQYYKNHRRRIVYFWYDHTATAEYSHAGAQYVDVVRYLRKNGWVVVERYIGSASVHERRYTMWSHLLKEDNTYPKRFRYNRERCKYLALSMFQAQAEFKRNGYGKDKKSELNPSFPAEEATHYSEAEDMLIYGILESGLDYNIIEQLTGNSISFM